MTDALLGPILDDLRVCLADALTTTMGGAPCATVLTPGSLAPADRCSCTGGRGVKRCGQGWVRLDRLFPSGERFPSQDQSTKTSCTSVLAATIEVGVYRCLPTLGPQGAAPAPDAVTTATLVQADDAIAIARAISCCKAVTSRPNLLGAYTPRDGGDCGGGAFTVTVQLLRR